MAGLALAALASVPACPSPLVAQEPWLIPRLRGPIELDGLPFEDAWEAIEPLPVAVHSPTFGATPSELTEFRVAHDGAFFYASGRFYDSDPDGIRVASLNRDDGSLSNDWFVLVLDTFNDKENTLAFATNPAGIRTDIAWTADAQNPPNFSWNTYWEVAVRQTPEGWFVEMRIPFSSLRFQEADDRVVMGMTVWRGIARRNELITFPAIPPRWGFTSVFKASQAREVVLEGVRGRTPLYLTPYALGGTGHHHRLDGARTAYDRDEERVGEVGLDVKYGVASNLTLDLSYNTDFAQVEADDQQVNLTRFSLFFPEKRLFFQERASAFEFAVGDNEQLFYSRRIGLHQGEPVPLHGGGRLTGRLGGWDVGVLTMQAAAGEERAAENFGVVRLRRQSFNENSYLGGIFTTRSGGDRANLVSGLDALLRLADQEFLSLSWAQSFSSGDATISTPLERSLSRGRLQRRGTDGFTYALDLTRVTPGFEPDLGFLRRRDYLRLGDQVAYGWRPGPASRLLRHTLQMRSSAYWRGADGTLETMVLNPEWVAEKKSGHILAVGLREVTEDLATDFRLAAGASVPTGRYRFRSAQLTYHLPAVAMLRGSVSAEGGSFFDGRRATGRIAPFWNASRHLVLGGLYDVNLVSFPQRDQRLTTHIVRLRVGATVNTRLSAAAFVQHNRTVGTAFGNLRLRYNPREGDDLYLVFNLGLHSDRLAHEPTRPLVDHQLFLVKYSRTFDLGF